MSRDDLLLGIDIGTTQTKVGAFYLDGRLAAMASADYPPSFTGETNVAEQHPADWWAATLHSLQRVLPAINVDRLVAMSVGGQGPTVVALDRTLKPVGPALTWLDQRAGQELQWLSERINLAPIPEDKEFDDDIPF